MVMKSHQGLAIFCQVRICIASTVTRKSAIRWPYIQYRIWSMLKWYCHLQFWLLQHQAICLTSPCSLGNFQLSALILQAHRAGGNELGFDLINRLDTQDMETQLKSSTLAYIIDEIWDMRFCLLMTWACWKFGAFMGKKTKKTIWFLGATKKKRKLPIFHDKLQKSKSMLMGLAFCL